IKWVIHGRDKKEERKRDRKEEEERKERKRRGDNRESYLCTLIISDYNESTTAAPRTYSSHTDCRGTS
ncbi:hypothetical protein KJ032_26550, partial [Salmonella enterica subsp. enterica serovar Typhimurium]|nr:hypothetical protein [Salmonella enterica subsp. enterica serovar Typhimurium]